MPSAKELAKALAYRGEIRNTPQNSFLGGVANFLSPVSEFADRDKLPESIPLLGGMSFADLSGLKGAQSLVNDMSYGTPPIRGASLQTAKVDPRVLDLAGVSGAMMPVGKALGKAALKKAAEQIQNKTGFAKFMPDTRMGIVPEGASMPQRPKLQVKPPKEDIYSVADANFSMGIPSGNKTVKIGTLQGSMSSAAGDAERVKKLAGQMSADGGYIERLIVDQNGNVIEGQHRLNALRSLGVTDIPVSVIQDASPTYDLLMKSGKLRSEHARQIVRDSADMLKSEGGDVSAVLSGYDLPKGYEQYFMDAVNDLSKPKAKAMSAPDNVGGAMMQRPKTEFEILHDTAQKNAALPKDKGGLGLPANNTYIDRAGAMAGLTAEDAASRAHQVGNLDFTNIPISEFKGKLVHKSPSYNGRQSSEYRIGEVGGDPVYMRKANHWGRFGTNIKEGDNLANAFADINGISDDQFGRVGSLGNQWNINGPIADKINALKEQRKLAEPFSQEATAIFEKMYPLMKKSQAGYIPIDNLVGRLPEKIASFNTFDAPIITLPNGQIRSRFAAFDPMRRHEADILAGVGVGGMLDPQAIAEALRQQDRK